MASVNNRLEYEQEFRLPLPVTSGQLRAFIAQMDSVIDMARLQDTVPFTDAGADSLDFFNIILEVQNATGVIIADKDIEKVNTLAGLAAYLNAKVA